MHDFNEKMCFFGKTQKLRDSLVLSSIFLIEMIIYVYTRKLMHAECLYFKYSARKKFRNSDCRHGHPAQRPAGRLYFFMSVRSKNSTASSIGSAHEVNIPKWSSSIMFFGKTMEHDKNKFSNIFFGLTSPRTRFFEDFQKIMIFDLQPYF